MGGVASARAVTNNSTIKLWQEQSMCIGVKNGNDGKGEQVGLSECAGPDPGVWAAQDLPPVDQGLPWQDTECVIFADPKVDLFVVDGGSGRLVKTSCGSAPATCKRHRTPSRAYQARAPGRVRRHRPVDRSELATPPVSPAD